MGCFLQWPEDWEARTKYRVVVASKPELVTVCALPAQIDRSNQAVVGVRGKLLQLHLVVEIFSNFSEISLQQSL